VKEQKINEQSLSKLGSMYRHASDAKLACYQFAQEIHGFDNAAITPYAKGVLDLAQLQQLTDLEVGTMLAVDWGLSVPESVFKKLSVKMVTPAKQTKH